MKIQHISNSFIIVETVDAKIVCDPWVGYGNHGGWHSFPEYNISDLISLVENCTHVYISHLHSDHLDLDFLKSAELNKKTFIIKEFTSPALKNRLKLIGVEEIVEIYDFKNFKISEKTNISIVPQLTSNSADLIDSINYSLDTSIIFNSEGITFFNQVDNPLSLENFREIKQFISTNYGCLDVACFACGAASEYPQCFKGIDRGAEMLRVICNSLEKLIKTVEITKPANTFLAGGAYFIPGKFYLLNKYIGQPTTGQIKSILASKTNYVEFKGGESIYISRTDRLAKISPAEIPCLTENISDSIRLHQKDKYAYQFNKYLDNNLIFIEFDRARSNYFDKLKQYGIILNRRIEFKIYNDLEIDLDLNILSEVEFSLELQPDEIVGPEDRYIEIHIDKNAFSGCLARKLIWNQVISGSLCVFVRVPNTYEPDLLFSLNFLVS
jgi:L-ascorbate metabolism protein UlaG (beta-lactamase superfamily)